ncbi:MAG: ABC transporter ATP-binding protein [Aeromicrobium sp.]
MPAAFELSKVSVVRPGKVLLDSVDWRVEEGERWVVLGSNGAGKTTLLQIIGAHLHPTTGKVKILGERLGRVDVFDLRTRIGHTSTAVADRIPPAESVRDVVLSAAYAVTGRWQEQYDDEDHVRANQIMGEWGILPLAGRTFGTLSEGERKRVLIARALMTDPELLLLDEPGAGLDLGAREDLLASLEVLSGADDSPVLVMVSHHVEEIPVGFTHVMLLREGRVVAAGPIAETLTADSLSEAFGMPITLSSEEGRYAARAAL